MEQYLEQLCGEETVLLVDDEDLLRNVVSDLLSQLGYRVLPAASAQEALTLAGEQKAIDLVVTDVVMPGMSGPELVKKLQESRTEVKALFISGYTGGKFADFEIGPDPVLLQKPFTIKMLAGKIRELLDT
jgi:two-component system, cell cycle sensor histidine kinase and response regulator CckA